MKILGIDYGRAKVGVALGVNNFSEPLKVIRYQDIDRLIEQIVKVVQVELVEKVVVGVSEGNMGEESKNFSLVLSKKLNIPVVTHDETLTSKDAQRMSMEANVPRNKRKQMEDAFAATIMLQNYLDMLYSTNV